MHVVYAPENPADGDRQEWTFTPGRIKADEAQIIEREFGGTWDEFQAGVQQGSIVARRVMLWHLMRLTHPSLRLDNVPNFYSDELEVSYSVKELTGFRDRIIKSNRPAKDKEQTLTAIDVQMTEAMEREAAQGGPKAPSESSSTTSSTSGG